MPAAKVCLGDLEHGRELQIWGPLQIQGKFGVLYASDSPETCRAERLRLVQDETLLIDHVIAHIEVRLTKVLDLTDASIRRAISVSKAELVRDDFSLTQAIGHLAQQLGFEALRVP